MSARPQLLMFTIYEKPKDHPNGFMVRAWRVESKDPTPLEATRVDTLEEARQLIPAGMVKIPRDPSDDPVIVESWI